MSRLRKMSSSDSGETTPLLSSQTSSLQIPDSSSTEVLSSSADSSAPNCFKMAMSKYFGDIKVHVYIFTILFAIASWIDINGLWVELPLMVHQLPEGWNLPSYLTIIIQVANLGPLAYTVANKLAPTKVKEWPVVYLIIAVGGVACMLLVFFWDRTSYVLGAERSTALISLASFLALVDCTSSVVFLPYMAMFKPQYMTAFYIGEGMSGFIPGIVGLIQGVGGDPDCVNTSVIIHNETTGINRTEWKVIPEYAPPLFSVEVFFIFLFVMICVSGIAFSFLNFMPSCRMEMVKNSVYSPQQTEEVTYSKPVLQESTGTVHSIDLNTSTDVGYVTDDQGINSRSKLDNPEAVIEIKIEEPSAFSDYQFVFLLVATAWINALTNGVIPSTQSYSCLPYGSMAYTLAVRLSSIANPAACFVALFLPSKSVPLVAGLSLTGSALASYQLYLAATSPYPPLVGTFGGEFLVVVTSVMMTGIFSYAKVTIATILRDRGRTALLWCGGVQQIGSFCGAITTFLLVNIFQLFTSKAPCT